MSSSQRPLLRSKIPRVATAVLFQSPATGRSPAIPKGPRHLSTVQSSHCPLPLKSRNHWPVLGRKTPGADFPLPSQSPTTARSSTSPKGPRHLSTIQPSHCPLPLKSRNHWPVLGRKTPGADFPLPSQSPTTARSSTPPKGPRHLSTAQPSQRSLPLRSNFQSPVFGSKTPICTVPVPAQSPTTGRSSCWPKGPRQPSTWQPSHTPLPFRSTYHLPVLGRKTSILMFTDWVKGPVTEVVVTRETEVPLEMVVVLA